ncbi:BlaI/MecI/CopY family transcriptional regulator [Clostridium sp. JS66]|uniref:BlaI/MecI/CopY family transcriptional regulator n=1 Tax=Clostridium sp. JS66 TaxID=3064705 RepID=UPI00298EC399|nr:BlaI/MecI/CopY family transcriptional regulator [Clostridium sp. JS66]WPC40226.1 BlaI/MecI/CopY family transcriptional regulator [Clostridium sp. JS66]
MSDLPKISEAEYKVMKIIWLNTPISTNEVIDKLIETSTWNPKTIQTLLSRLVKKGAITYEKNSRTFVYTPLVKEEEYLERESRSFLNRFYNGTLASMVLSFLEKDKLTEDDINELKDILDKKVKGNNKNV